MKKNYYDILEINKNASPEILEKAYKTLVKKYHPDLQTGELKQQYEEKLKLINEAYNVLSDKEKRAKYDLELERQELIKNNQNDKPKNVEKQNLQRENNDEQLQHEIQRQQQYEMQKQYNEEYARRMNEAVNKAYHDAYIQDLRNRGYKIRYRKSLKDYGKDLLTLLIVFFILFLLWQIPFIKNYFIDMYNDNFFIKFIADTFLGILGFRK